MVPTLEPLAESPRHRSALARWRLPAAVEAALAGILPALLAGFHVVGLLYFLINIPFYIFGLLALGKAFTLKTFCAVALLSLYSEVLPRWIHIESIHPVFAAIIGGLLAGAGLLMLVRHRASLGGLGVMAIYLQKKRGWSAGTLQMIADGFIVCGALAIVEPTRVALSILGALVLNMVLAINHRPGRYFGQ